MSIKSHNYARKMTHQVNMTPAKSTTWIRCLKPIWYKNRPSFCKLSSVPHMNTVTHIYYTKTTTQPPTHNAPIIFKKIKAYKCIYLYCDKNCNKIRKKRARFYNPKINVYFFIVFEVLVTLLIYLSILPFLLIGIAWFLTMLFLFFNIYLFHYAH